MSRHTSTHKSAHIYVFFFINDNATSVLNLIHDCQVLLEFITLKIPPTATVAASLTITRHDIQTRDDYKVTQQRRGLLVGLHWGMSCPLE